MTSEERHDSDQQRQTAGIDFLDFLFTVAIGVGLTPEILGGSYRGIVTEFRERPGGALTVTEWQHILSFTVGLLALTLSWFGYHASIQKLSLKYDSVSGLIRFQMDVLLVITYGAMMIWYQDFAVVLWLLFAVHVAFFIWDIIKMIEHRPEFAKRWAHGGIYGWRRELVSLFWAIALGVILLTLVVFDPHRSLWLVEVAAILSTVAYRIHKMRPLPGEQKLLDGRLRSMSALERPWRKDSVSPERVESGPRHQPPPRGRSRGRPKRRR